MKIKGFDDTIAWYDNDAEQYAAALQEAVPVAAIEKFLEALPLNPSILEAGCGPGRESTVFHQKGARVVGVDLSEGLLDIARKNNPDVEYIKADFLELPFPGSKFIGVWAHASLVHLEGKWG
ncbi:hypothetical protein A2952_02845 [Candidatus Kaiserbacteria bacterium RIFCSPLOWO2_01_FULL_59_34]|nr:MAG: hypothetical protein A2766_00340 [Candidatus Kaiserbacteria bacterium RIFCSPHIGHO2_01_FULL_58_22]OGG79080.1 MAG: hypothetical protein A2952_02845 [Candidatus Kaiserbacteria bacterium RIFCSPLOWO2_01_FULL_59_34]OGG84428.1 MAG: hypothetical protein A3I47_02100 [Candidatus Kaiserbacteria bacterium RIFCSPLOWO2_02_FULL_59_19]